MGRFLVWIYLQNLNLSIRNIGKNTQNIKYEVINILNSEVDTSEYISEEDLL